MRRERGALVGRAVWESPAFAEGPDRDGQGLGGQAGTGEQGSGGGREKEDAPVDRDREAGPALTGDGAR
jgi:hypothetical protein